MHACHVTPARPKEQSCKKRACKKLGSGRGPARADRDAVGGKCRLYRRLARRRPMLPRRGRRAACRRALSHPDILRVTRPTVAFVSRIAIAMLEPAIAPRQRSTAEVSKAPMISSLTPEGTTTRPRACGSQRTRTPPALVAAVGAAFSTERKRAIL